jgi:tripartite-type tricarboxylate transporter receptor subunit TctC
VQSKENTIIMPRLGLHVLIKAFVVVISLCSANADTSYPNRPIHIIVPFPPGGLNDNVVRTIQRPLQEELGQPIVIENRTGASGIVGTDAVAKSMPDGYTLLVVASSHTVLPVMHAKLPYDAERDFVPISILVRDPLLFLVNNSVAAKTLPEFIAFAKSQPGKTSYATPGTASQSHLVTELLSQRAGIKMIEVPYRGGAPAMLALTKGEVQFAVLSRQLSMPQIQSGTIRAIASGGQKRDPHFLALPTLKETGFPNMEAAQWVGILAPAGTPKEIVMHINAALRRILSTPDVIAKLDAQGVTPAANSPEEFQNLISTEIKEWQEVAQRAGITPF